jgi:sugar-specific transcriptional regulator TrmB
MQLSNLGINQEEYTTYAEILKNPPTELAELAKRTKIKRATLYNVLSKLKQKGLIYTPKASKDPIRYYAVDPDKLVDFAKDNKDKIDQEFQKLKAQVPLLNVFLKNETIPDNSEYYSFANDNSPFFMEELVAQSKKQMYGLSNHHWFEAFKSDKEMKILPSKYLDTVMRVGDRYAFTSDKETKEKTKELLRINPQLVGKWEPRWIDRKKFDFPMNINTFDDKVFFTVPGKDPLSLEGWTTHYFRNQEVARALQSLFQYIWETAENLNPK